MKLTYIAFPMLFLFLLGCHSATSDPNPIHSPTSEPSQAVKDAFGGKLFYQNATPDEIAQCKALGEDQCVVTKVDRSFFCGFDALVFLHFSTENTDFLFDCVNKKPQELVSHLEQDATVKYVFYGDGLHKEDILKSLIHGRSGLQYHSQMGPERVGLAGLIKDEKGRWYVVDFFALGVDEPAPERPQISDAHPTFVYNEIPTEPEEMKAYFQEAVNQPEKFCSKTGDIQQFRSNFLEEYQNKHKNDKTCEDPTLYGDIDHADD